MFAALNLDNRSRMAMGEIVTGNYFQQLGVPAAIGRRFPPPTMRPGAPLVVMVSHRTGRVWIGRRRHRAHCHSR
jgi:hypothetical protein